MSSRALQHRHRRLRLHGPDALQRVPQGLPTSSTPRYQPVLKAVCGRDEAKTKAFADKWGYESTETDWRKLIERKDIDAIDICTPNNTHAEIAIAAATGGQDGALRKAARDGRRRRARRWCEAVEKAGVPNTVWYNYRRVPAVTLAKQLDRRRASSGKIFHYRANFLQDWTISRRPPAGRRRPLAARRRRRPARGVTGDLLAHCIDTAIWLNGSDRQRQRDDRDVHQGAQAHAHRQGREGRHRRRLHVPLPLRQRLARPLRIHPLRPRPQGALHVRDQRRERARSSGTCTTCTGCSTSTTATKARPRLAQRPRHRRRPALHEELVGAGPADRLRAHLRPPGRRLPRSGWRRASPARRRSATRWKRRKSATRFWSLGGRGSGWSWGQHDKWRVAPFVDKN